ncbi:MAG: ATP-binding cassette domain-containing protein, partial [Gemmataceae bacterium]
MFLKLTDLTRVFANGAVGLKGLDLEVAEGELLAILGPSGSGKTTLLRLICGLETPTRGEIHQDGKPTRTVPPHLRGIALVPQKGGLFPFLTVRQNLAFGKESGVWPFLWIGKPVQEHLETVASQLGIRELLDRYPHEISGGQGQRVVLGRALVHRPR